MLIAHNTLYFFILIIRAYTRDRCANAMLAFNELHNGTLLSAEKLHKLKSYTVEGADSDNEASRQFLKILNLSHFIAKLRSVSLRLNVVSSVGGFGADTDSLRIAVWVKVNIFSSHKFSPTYCTSH